MASTQDANVLPAGETSQVTTALHKNQIEPHPAPSPETDLALPAAMQVVSDLSTDWILVVDSRSCVAAISPALARLWKVSANTLIVQHINDTPHADHFPDAFTPCLRKALTGTANRFGARQRLTGQSAAAWPFIEYRFKPWRVDNVQLGVAIRIEDRTAHEQAKHEVIETSQRLTDFTNATSDWLWEMDSELRFTWVSAQMEGFFDLAREEFYGKQRRVNPGNPQEAKAWSDHKILVGNRQPFRDFTYRLKTPSGDRWARISGVPVFDKTGKFTGYRGTASDDTEVENMKSQAKQSESRFIRAIDEFPGSFALYDEHAKLFVYNRRYAQIHAFLGDRLEPGLSYQDCLNAQIDAELFVQHNGLPIDKPQTWVEHRLKRLQLPNDSVELRCADGRWMRLALQRLPDGGCLETLVDITTQKNSELTIKEERNLLRSLIDNIPDFIYAKDTRGRFIVKNRSVSHYMKAARQSSLGLTDEPDEQATDFDYYTHEVAESFRREDLRVIEQGDAVLDQEEYRNSIWISTSKTPLLDTEGEIIGLVGTGRNISEQKLAEARLRESHERFRDFAETAAELFWETDANLNITYVSELYQELTGFPPSAILGMPYEQAIFSRIEDTVEFERVSRRLNARQAFSDLEISIAQSHSHARHIVLSGKPCFDHANAFIGYRGTGRDITKARNLEDMLQYQASHDELTQLPNRREFLRRLELTLKYSQSTEHRVVLGYLDLDQFKVVNDSVGHLAGDELLVQIASLIEGQLRKSDTIARLGGDEFGILIHDVSIDNAVSTVERIIKQVETFRFYWNKQLFGVGVSIGLVEIGDTGIDASELMSRADVACFAAKDAGRGRVHVYSHRVTDLSQQHKQLLMAAGIKDSIATNRFQLYAQPIASLSKENNKTLTIEHYEILLRLTGEDGALILPGTFIPAAERYELMGNIDRWVITNTMQQMHNHLSSNSEITVTINLSGQSLSDTSLASFATGEFLKYQINPARICFEITETAAIRNLALARTFIADMKQAGCTFALDDFGSGLSSFGYLKHFDVDYLKIDGSFVRDIANDQTDRIMVTSIDQIGKSLGIRTIAEFVENDEIIEELQKIGVDLLQGYAIGKPVAFTSVF